MELAIVEAREDLIGDSPKQIASRHLLVARPSPALKNQDLELFLGGGLGSGCTARPRPYNYQIILRCHSVLLLANSLVSQYAVVSLHILSTAHLIILLTDLLLSQCAVVSLLPDGKALKPEPDYLHMLKSN
jgi:hypothetical protein